MQHIFLIQSRIEPQLSRPTTWANLFFVLLTFGRSHKLEKIMHNKFWWSGSGLTQENWKSFACSTCTRNQEVHDMIIINIIINIVLLSSHNDWYYSEKYKCFSLVHFSKDGILPPSQKLYPPPCSMAKTQVHIHKTAKNLGVGLGLIGL